jgi:hypothetical protein
MDGGIGPAGMQSRGSEIGPRSFEVSRLVIVRLFSFLKPSVALHRKVGPGDVFLITIRDGFQEPVHFCFRPADTTLPKLEDTPTLLEQFGSVSKVSFHILVEFQSPEFFASSRGCGISAAKVSVPETAMNENADVVAGKHHVWPTWKLPRMQSIPEAMPMEQLPDLHLGRCIASANSGHHPRPDLFTDYIHD